MDGARTREEAFHATIAAEERPFLGDGSAFAVLDRLAPLLDGMRLNDRGAAILVGGHTWEAPEERWIGGMRIPPGRPPWHWVPPNGRIWEG